MITNIYFVRHAEPDCSNHNDLTRSLTEKGKKDAIRVADYLEDKKIDFVLSSPYRRSIATIEPFSIRNNIQIKVLNDFRERKVGSCWIENFEEFTKMQWQDFSFKLDNGECLYEVQERNISALKLILKRFSWRNIVVGTHGTALSTIINYYVPSYGYKNFNEIRLLMPRIVKFTFDEMDCIEIKKIDKLNSHID